MGSIFIEIFDVKVLYAIYTMVYIKTIRYDFLFFLKQNTILDYFRKSSKMTLYLKKTVYKKHFCLLIINLEAKYIK